MKVTFNVTNIEWDTKTDCGSAVETPLPTEETVTVDAKYLFVNNDGLLDADLGGTPAMWYLEDLVLNALSDEHGYLIEGLNMGDPEGLEYDDPDPDDAEPFCGGSVGC